MDKNNNPEAQVAPPDKPQGLNLSAPSEAPPALRATPGPSMRGSVTTLKTHVHRVHDSPRAVSTAFDYTTFDFKIPKKFEVFFLIFTAIKA